MAIDFDALLAGPLLEIYGLATKPTYRPLVSQPGVAAFQVAAIFDRNHQIILEQVAGSELKAPGMSTTTPVVTVSLAHFAVRPATDDEIVIGTETFLVWDVQPDGQGMVDLILREKM